MRIVIDNRESGTTTGRYSDKLIEHLHKLRPEIEIIILSKPHRIDYLKKLAPNFKIVESAYKEFTFSEQLGFLKLLRSFKADLVHFTMPQQPWLYNRKKITTIHDLTTLRYRNPAKNAAWFKIKQIIYGLLIKHAARRSAIIITASQFAKKDVAQYSNIPSSKISVVYEAADRISDLPKSMPGLNRDSFIMYVGRPQPHKNLRRLAEAFSIVRQTHPQLKLVLAGKNDVLYDQLKKWAKKEHIEGILFTDFVDEAELRWLYENCAAYVFASLSEGFGLPGLEAMAHGAPLISSNTTCLPEIYGPAAHYFKPESVLDMSDKIKEVLDDPHLKNKLVAAGKVQVQKYSWEDTAKQTLEIYKKALDIKTS